MEPVEGSDFELERASEGGSEGGGAANGGVPMAGSGVVPDANRSEAGLGDSAVKGGKGGDSTGAP